MPEKITFIASFPAIQSAIKITGDGNGMRIQLDIPEIDVINALHVIAMRQQAFRVTIEPSVTERNDETKEGATGNPNSVGRRRLTKRRDQPAGG